MEQKNSSCGGSPGCPKALPKDQENHWGNNVLRHRENQFPKPYKTRGKEGFWSHFGKSDLRKARKPLGLSVFRDAFSRPSENVQTIRKTMFCDNAKVRWGNIINTVENDSFWGQIREMEQKRPRKPLGFHYCAMSFCNFRKTWKTIRNIAIWSIRKRQ